MQTKDISTLTVLRSCLESHPDDWRKGEGSLPSWEIIMRYTGAPEKVVYSAMSREINRGCLEYGVSLRTAWLTEEGKAKLDKLINEEVTP